MTKMLLKNIYLYYRTLRRQPVGPLYGTKSNERYNYVILGSVITKNEGAYVRINYVFNRRASVVYTLIKSVII